MTRKIAVICALLVCCNSPASLQAGERGASLGPLPITSITAEDIRETPIANIDDLVNTVPSFTPGIGEQPTVTIRGESRGGQPLIIVDGVRTTGQVSSLDPELIDKVDVLQGPSATALYGTAGSKGVILVTTRPQVSVGDPTGSAALPSATAILNGYDLAIQSNEYCDATNGAYLPVHLWFPTHDYGVGDFSKDFQQQYWGSVSNGFQSALPPVAVPPPVTSQTRDDVEPTSQNIKMTVAEQFRASMSNVSVRSSYELTSAITLMQVFTIIVSNSGNELIKQGLLDPASVLSAVQVALATSNLGQDAGASAVNTPLPMHMQFTQLYLLLMEIIAHPQTAPDSKALALYTLFQNPSFFNPMLSDAGFVLGLFNPDNVLEQLVQQDAFEVSTRSYTQFEGLLDQVLMDPDISFGGKAQMLAILLLNAQLFGMELSDAAFAMGYMDPSTVLETLRQATQYHYLAVQPNTQVTIIDQGQEMLDQWLDMFESVNSDPNLTDGSKLQISRGLLYYALWFQNHALVPDFSVTDFDAESFLAGFYSDYGQLSPAGYTATDPFLAYDLPPVEAFDLRFCNEEQKQQLLALIKQRNVEHDKATSLWDYMRNPTTSHAEQADATQDMLDAAAARDELNLQLQELWKGCTRTDIESRTSATFGGEPSVSVKIVEKGVGGVTKPAAGLAVSLQRSNYGNEADIPHTPGANKNVEKDAGVGSGRFFTGRNGIGWLGGVPKSPSVPSSPGDMDLENSAWQIKADYSNNSIGVKLEYDRVDSIVQTFSGYGRPGMRFDELPAEFRDMVPEGVNVTPDFGFSIGNNFNVSYAYKETDNIDLSVFDTFPDASWSNNLCGDSALPQEGSGYLTASETPIKSLADRWALKKVGLTQPAARSGQPVVVALIDTGIDWDHLDIAWENLWHNDDEIPGNNIDDDNNGYIDDLIGWDFTAENNRPWDFDGHGTFVAGLIGATTGNDAGIDGINPDVQIMVLKALNNFGRTRASYVARAIVYAADNGAQVINLSVSGPGFPPVVHDAVNYAHAKGVLVVAAAGNRSEDIDSIEPAVPKNVMLVTATDSSDRRAIFSNAGSSVSVAAPGVDVISLRARATDFLYNKAETVYVKGDAFMGDDKRYYRSSGTSFATPIVSGIASLVWSARPDLSAQQVRRVIEQSARDVEVAGWDRLTGFGVVDARAALAADPAFFIDAEIHSVSRADSDGEVLLSVRGVADANLFGYAKLEIGAGSDPASWQKVGENILERVHGAELGRFPASLLAESGTWTIRLIVDHATGKQREIRFVLNLE